VERHAVNEKVWDVEEKGEWGGKWVVDALKPKDVNQDLVLLVDDHRNITGIRGLRYNAGTVFDPHDFLIYTHLGLFGNPGGMSDFRAAYSSYWMLDTVFKLRAMGAEKRAFPVVAGEYPDATKQKQLEAALAKVKSTNWLAVPKDVKLQLLALAGAAEDYFQSFTRDLRERLHVALSGAFLQAMGGA